MNPIQTFLNNQICRMILMDLILLLMVAFYRVRAVRELPRLMRWGWLTMGFGVFSNWLVMTFNGFQMPVVDSPWFIPANLAWRDARIGDRFLWLSDRFLYGNYMFSVGDILLGMGFLTYIVGYASIRFRKG